MKCNNCVEKIEKNLSSRPLIITAKVNLEKKEATILHRTTPEEVVEFINEGDEFSANIVKNTDEVDASNQRQ